MASEDRKFQTGQSVKVTCQLLQSEVEGAWSKTGRTSPAPTMLRGKKYPAKIVKHVPQEKADDIETEGKKTIPGGSSSLLSSHNVLVPVLSSYPSPPPPPSLFPPLFPSFFNTLPSI
jgi:hypothetical protein